MRDILNCMTVMKVVLVLTTVIDVQQLPESERDLPAEIRATAASTHAMADRILNSRADELRIKLLPFQYLDAVDNTRYLLTMVNQRLAALFESLAVGGECRTENS
jgi:hypothetical protein